MTQGELFDPGGVNGAEGTLCTCRGIPHTPKCRLHKWAVKHCGVARLPQAPEIKRQAAGRLLILGRLQQGPALASELVACGGGYRYSARLKELRDAGHNITSENLGEGVWRYTLIQP